MGQPINALTRRSLIVKAPASCRPQVPDVRSSLKERGGRQLRQGGGRGLRVVAGKVVRAEEWLKRISLR